jgi:hypothetical protein
MIALIYLAFVGIYFLIMRKISKIFPKKYQQWLFVCFVFALPVGYLNWYPLYPSYKEFTELCEHDRNNVFQTKQVNIIKVPRDHITNDYIRKEKTDPIVKRSLYQAVEYEGYGRKNDYWRMNVSNGALMPKVAIKKFINDYSVTNKTQWLVPQSLQVDIYEVVDPELGVMGNSKNYTYYPYGNTWAKLLGMSSGNAPNRRCQKRWVDYDIFKIYIPLRSK